MTTIRDDAREKLQHTLTLIEQGMESESHAMRTQHLTHAMRLVEMVMGSVVEDENSFSSRVGQRPEAI